jgi:hypothetical protein
MVLISGAFGLALRAVVSPTVARTLLALGFFALSAGLAVLSR